MKLLNIVLLLVTLICSPIIGMDDNDNGMDCSQDGDNTQIIKTISQQSFDDSQPTQPMDTFPDKDRSLELEDAIKKNNVDQITTLIMDGVRIDPVTQKIAIEAYLSILHSNFLMVNPEADEMDFSGLNVVKKKVAEHLNAIIDAAMKERAARDQELAKTLDSLRILPTALEQLVLSYKP